MKYTMTVPEQLYIDLLNHLQGVQTEAAAYLLCRRAVMEDEVRLLPRQLIPVEPSDIIASSRIHMSIASRSFRAAMKEAARQRCSFVFVHSHPDGPDEHSPQDDREEPSLFRTAYNRIRIPSTHGSIVVAGAGWLTGRVWHEDGTSSPISTTRIIGSRFRFFFDHEPDYQAELFDRHVRAFGADLQPLLARLHVGIVGSGGTGSSVAEQLIRLGVGRLTFIDGGRLEGSNVTRGYGSTLSDVGKPKPELLERLAQQIGLGTKVRVIRKDCTFPSTIQALKSCDVIFGCTDDQFGRSLLNRLAVYYLIPVFDMGVKIESEDGVIGSIQGRVTTLLPGTACLFCRGRITAEGVRRESLDVLSPAEAEGLRREGYIPELQGPAPSMIPFTTSVAAAAVLELLHRLTQMGGVERRSTEVLHLFDQTRLRTNSTPPQIDGCFCGDQLIASRGDTTPMLDTLWRQE